MELLHQATTRATNFGSEPDVMKTKLFKSFLDPSKLKHNPKQIYFALEITQIKLTKSIKHKLKLIEPFKK